MKCSVKNNSNQLWSFLNLTFWLAFPLTVVASMKTAFLAFYETLRVNTVQDFLIKLGIKPHMHQWEISIFPLNNVIVRPTKIMNRADKNWAHF